MRRSAATEAAGWPEEGVAMRRTWVLLSVVAVVLLGLLAAGRSLTATAQDATPSGEAAPVTLEMLGSAPAADAPGMNLVLARVTLAPGAVVPAHRHPGQLVVTVESGTLAYTILDEGRSLRAGAGTPTAAEVIEPGAEATLGPGEWFVYEANVVHMDRNPGDEPAVVLITGLVAADQPFLIPVDMDMATPAG
jgi:quercetin dioxygenase-like cupin family protein